jgi:hypothetical protein
MNSKWLANLSDQEKTDLKASLQAAVPAFWRLTDLLEKRLEENKTLQRSRDTYDKAAWPYFQADCNGYQRAIIEMLKLIEVE